MLKKKNIDMTQGPIVIPMILFALPMIGGSLCQLLYNTVDFIYVGNFVSSTAAGAVGRVEFSDHLPGGLFHGHFGRLQRHYRPRDRRERQ